MLTAGDPVKNARALLRNALPIENKPIRTIQSALEGVSEQLRVPGSKALGPVSRAVKKASGALAGKRAEISAAFAPGKKAAGDAALDGLDRALKDFEAVLESGDKQQIPAAQQAALAHVSQAEEALVKGFPFEVPSKYASLPQLKGRATLEMKLTLKEARQDGVKGGILTIVADGYNAPVTVRERLSTSLFFPSPPPTPPLPRESPLPSSLRCRAICDVKAEPERETEKKER